MRKSFVFGMMSSLLFVAVSCNPHADVDGDPPVPTAPRLPGSQSSNAVSGGGDAFKVKFETTKGDFVVQVHPSWAPRGAARFRELVESGFYDGCGFFRVVPDFMVQFGINGNPEVQAKWRDAKIDDDPVTESNKKGYVTFATSGKNSRTAQMFINFKDNSRLDVDGFSPFGKVIEGMNVATSINSEYREQPDQGRIQYEGNQYLKSEFPRLDYIVKATVIGDAK